MKFLLVVRNFVCSSSKFSWSWIMEKSFRLKINWLSSKLVKLKSRWKFFASFIELRLIVLCNFFQQICLAGFWLLSSWFNVYFGSSNFWIYLLRLSCTMMIDWFCWRSKVTINGLWLPFTIPNAEPGDFYQYWCICGMDSAVKRYVQMISSKCIWVTFFAWSSKVAIFNVD